MTESVKPLAELKKKQFSTKQQSLHNFSLGNEGERQACQFLHEKGYHILDTNVCVGNKEVDIIAVDSEIDELVFIEVKTRQDGYYGDPSHAVNRDKLRSMQYVSAVYRKQKRLDKDYRFDIISILPDKIEHFENITWSFR